MGPGPQRSPGTPSKIRPAHSANCLLTCLKPTGVTAEGLAWARTFEGLGFRCPPCRHVRAWLRHTASHTPASRGGGV